MSTPGVVVEWIDHDLSEIARTLTVTGHDAELIVLVDAGSEPEIGCYRATLDDAQRAVVTGLAPATAAPGPRPVVTVRADVDGEVVEVVPTVELDAVAGAVRSHPVATCALRTAEELGHVLVELRNRGTEPISVLLEPHSCRWVDGSPDAPSWSDQGVVLAGFRGEDRRHAGGIDAPATIPPGQSVRMHVAGGPSTTTGVSIGGVVGWSSESRELPTSNFVLGS